MNTPLQPRTRKAIALKGRLSSKRNSAKKSPPADLGSPANGSVASEEDQAKELATKTLFTSATVGTASPVPAPVNQQSASGVDLGTLTSLLANMIQPVIDKLDKMEVKVSRV